MNDSDDISEKSNTVAVHYSLTTFHLSLLFVPNFSSYLVQHIVAKVYQIPISGASPKILKIASTLVDKGTMMNLTPLFDVYFALDFSAKSQPSPRRERSDALWLAELQTSPDPPFSVERYFRTRHAVYDYLYDRLVYHLAYGHRIFVGVDFALGYPQGFAHALGIDTASTRAWQATWELLATLIEDHPNNRNNRFTVAADLNHRLRAPTPGPFWGTPITRQTPHFRATAPRYPFAVNDTLTLPRLRYTEQHATRSAQETWKLFGAGSVGSQTLLGIPFIHRLATSATLAPHTDIFPFTWHVSASSLSPRSLVIAEIYPSLTPIALDPALIKDQAQVRTTVQHFATLDSVGSLASLLAPPAALTNEEWQHCVNEEGWIVGVEGKL